ncbi:MAG: hypothetical protein Q4C98_08640 [Capnocytophaga sp.]|nr:hypothetical protein [Capnocytophaga sp.]
MKNRLSFVACLAILFAVSCSKDSKGETPTTVGGDILVQTAIPNDDGQSGSAYIQLIENIESQTLTNQNALPTGMSIAPFVYKNWIFAFPNFFGSDAAQLTKFSRENGTLQKVGALPLPGASQATNMEVLNEQKAYLGLTGLGKIIIFNPTTMTKINEIDLNTYGDPNPEPTGMVIRDNLLFVSLGQWKAGTWLPQEKSVEILVINTQTDQIEKHIKDTSSGLSFPEEPSGNRILMDENKDIYINCAGSYGQVDGFSGGILRIKNGTTEIDPDFLMKFDDITVPDAPGKIAYMRTSRYIKNGITYSYAAIQEYAPGKPISPMLPIAAPVKVDLKNKKITLIKEIPVTIAYSTGIGVYKDNTLLFGSMNANAKGFYTYDLTTGKVSSEPIIKVEGYPQYFYWFGN